MKNIFFLLLLITSNSFSNLYPGKYKGSASIQNHLNTTMFAQNMELKTYSLATVEMMLGVWRQIDDGTTVFINGAPNGFSLSVYHVLFEQLASETSKLCDPLLFPSVHLKFQTDFTQKILTLCDWPKKSAQDYQLLFSFWSNLIGFNAPSEEFQEWYKFFINEYQSEKAEMVIKNMLLSIFYSPYFLLQM